MQGYIQRAHVWMWCASATWQEINLFSMINKWAFEKKEKKRNFDIKSPSGCINPMEVERRGLNNSSHSVEDLIFSWRKVFFPPFLHMKFSHAVKWVSWERRQNATIASRAPTRSYRLSEAFFGRRRKTAVGLKWMRGFSFSSPPPPLPLTPHPSLFRSRQF